MSRAFILLALFFTATACGDDGRPSDAIADAPAAETVTPDDVAPETGVSADSDTPESPPDTAAPDAALDTRPDLPADIWQAVTLPACDGLAPGVEDCHYRLLHRPAACGGAACSRLIVYWSGGEQGCADGTYDPLLERWADSGLTVACAQPFTTSDESGRYPYADELERMHHLTRRIREHAALAWDGRYLVIAGVSHGATAPVAAIASARAFETRPEVWTGRDGTAVILFDGISDPARLEATIGRMRDPGCGLWHARFVGRYAPSAPLTHACDNGACYCAGGGRRWEVDTTVVGQVGGPDWPASPYTCADLGSPAQRIHYRVVSCGGGQAEPCGALGDIIPDDQQTRFSDALSTCPDLSVHYGDHPGCAHTLCGAWDFCGGKRAREWLDTLGW